MAIASKASFAQLNGTGLYIVASWHFSLNRRAPHAVKRLPELHLCAGSLQGDVEDLHQDIDAATRPLPKNVELLSTDRLCVHVLHSSILLPR